MTELKKSTVQGAKWLTIERLVLQVSSFSIGILLARLLGPEEFGLIAMVTVVTNLLQLFGDFGLGSAIIQKRVLSTSIISTAFWGNLSLGLILSLMLFLASGGLASFYEEPSLKILTQVMSFNLVLVTLAIVPDSLLRKKMEFKKLFIAKVTSVIVSGAIAVVLALNGFGVWVLVARTLIMSFIALLLLFILSAYKPSREFSKSNLKDLLNYSIPLLGTQLVSFGTRNLDNLLVGKFLGTAQLGVYSRAYQFLLLPVKNISGVITKVLFPAFSLIQDEKERVLQIFNKSIWLISNLVSPFMLCFFFCAEAFTMLVLGPKWNDIIPLLKIFSLTGFIQSLGTLVGSVFNSQAKTKLHFKLNIVTGLSTLIAIGIALNYNTIVLAWSITIMSFLILLLNYYFVAQILETTLISLLNKLSVSFISSVVVFILLFSIHRLILPLKAVWWELVLLPTVIFCLYIGMIRILDRENLRMILFLLKTSRKR